MTNESTRYRGKGAFEVGGEHGDRVKAESLVKRLQTIGKHCIQNKCVRVEILRIGFDEEPSFNPVVILITMDGE